MVQTFTLARLFGVLRDNRAFRRLYAANAVSQVGDWFNVVALFSLLLQLTGSGEAVALVLQTRLLPFFLVGPIAGVVADRVPRKLILIASDLSRCALVLCLLFVRRPDQVWIAYTAMTAHAILSAFFEPAQQALIPTLVKKDDLVLASTLENSLWSGTLAVGSALGGLCLAAVGRDAAFVLDAASFLGSAALLAGLPSAAARPADKQAIELSEEQKDPAGGLANLFGLRDLREGFRYVSTDARVRALLLAKASFGLTLGGVLVLLPFFGEKVFGAANGAGIAVFWTARGIGSFAGPFAAFRLVGSDEQSLRRGISLAFLMLVICYVGFAFSPVLLLAALCLAVANAGGSILWTSGATLLQRLVPDEIRGRVAGADLFGMTLLMSLSTFVTGRLLDRGASPRALMAACGLVAALPLAFWALQQRAFRER